MTTTDHAAPATYTFGRRDRGGLLLGFRAKQIALLGEGCVAVLAGLLIDGARGGALGVLILGCLATLALFPIQGRPAVDWAGPLGNHAYARARGRARYLGGVSALHRCRDVASFDLPNLGPALRVYETHTTTGPVAAVRIRDRWMLVLRVRGANYVLADRASQERRVSAWGALLSQSGQEGSRVAAVQWLERTIPDSGHDLTEWWTQRGDMTATYAAPYQRLIEQAGPAATRHETFVAVAIDAHRLRRPIRQAGGGPEGTTKVLIAECAWIRQALLAADIDVLGYLGAADLARVIRGQYDPASTTALDSRSPGRRPARVRPSRRASRHAKPVEPCPVTAGPMAAEPHWDHYRSDSGVHAVYWIAEWPSVPVEAAWIFPLIALGGVRRTVSLTAEPIAPSRSLREIRSQRVAKRADDAQRRRIGQVETAQDDEEAAALDRRERELVRGHTEYRFTGWITVTATDRDELEAACALVEQASVRSALEVRRVYGEVDQAFLRGALPLTQGVTR